LVRDQAIVIAQHRIPAHTNEIGRVPTLLDDVDLRDAVVTWTPHAQHDATAGRITVWRGGHYVLTVKGNQPGLLAQVTAVLPPGSGHHVTEDRGDGRAERRAGPVPTLKFAGYPPP
jgi:hypothetical protein